MLKWISDIELSDDERTAVLDSVERNVMTNRMIRSVDMSADVGPAIHFKPLSTQRPVETLARSATGSNTDSGKLPGAEEQIAFLPVHRLAGLIRSKQISSVELTKLYCPG